MEKIYKPRIKPSSLVLEEKMTKINRITIHGFKSFAHKTDIPFDNKFNCILGPNGSGKSNVGDAICFVLGRLSAKSMRVEKAANLVFNGSKDKKPASSAMVEIAFDNSHKLFPEEGPEVVISRTIEKEGNSTYRINGKKRTRTEILDLLGLAKINPEGYNIILQGDITRFVDMGGVERRMIIEEISDVAVYEDKKHKAMLELQKVEEKLNNAEIILKERKTHLKELKKDRDQALQYKEMKDTIDSNKATYVHLQIKERETAKGKFEQEISLQQEKINGAEKKISEFKNQITEHKKSIEEINKLIELKGEKEQLKVHKDIEDLKVGLAKDKTRVSTLKDEINKIQQRRDQFQIELQELEEKSISSSEKVKEVEAEIKKKQAELKETEERIVQFKKKNKIESSVELEKEVEEKDKVIEQLQEKVQVIRLQQQELLREKDKLEFQTQSIDERVKKVREVKDQNKEQIKVLEQQKNNFKAATLRLNQLLDLDSSFAAQLANARKKMEELQEKQLRLNAKTASLQEGLSSNQALKGLMEQRKKFRGIFGTVAELGQANKKFSLALEMAAGNRMQHLVVDNDKTAAECIDFLKERKLGTASFIPLNKIKSQDISAEDKKLLKEAGVHDFALHLINFKSEYNKAFSYVFGNTLVVEDIETARKVGIGRIKMATLDGNLAEGSGVMKGGFVNRRASVGFQEKDSLEELERAEAELSEMQGVLANVSLKREANEKEITALRIKKAELEGEIIKLEKSLHLDTGDLDASEEQKKIMQEKLKETNERLNGIQKEIGTINRDLADMKMKKQNLRSQVNELRNPRLLAQLTAFEESKQKCREEVLHLEAELKGNFTKVQQMFAPEKEKIAEILKQHDKEEINFNHEIKSLSSTVAVREKELEQKEKDSKEFYSKYKELFTKREKMSAEISKAENTIEMEREKSRVHERDVNLISLKNAEVKARLAGLQEELTRYKDAKILENKSVEELQQEIKKAETMLLQMSAVNLKALEIYEQIETEYNRLVEKKDGLDKEKIDVMTMMNEIETKKKEHFMKTFEKANENFQRIFTTLFHKGKAYLELENSEKPFEGGLSVKVKLTGNRFMDIKSLSGGEKTLTALSFIFAIQEYQPASFYILDEIDAALDKQNSETLSKLIRSYADRAQYIVISHNDSLISEADTLYGVSMQDGVSKVTSLRI